MKGKEIRRRFLEYFQEKGHTIVESSSLVPKGDPTLLFTNAGMVQFKTVFMGEDQREYSRAVTSQRCVRAGGKHNDLENVGYTARHHTFFEMLGNFSFGDYFKEQAIAHAWEFLTRELKIDPADLWVSIFDDDDEAFALWEKVEDLPKGRIVRMGEKDNFWAMGDTGPCGPCSEIHIDQGVEAGCGREDCALGCDCDRFLELWNLVFMQFNKAEDGTVTPLPKPSIDTGMGLERVAAVLQGKLNNYDSDLFTPIMEAIEAVSGKKYGSEPSVDTAMRVIADHARATTFLVADGVLPSNEGRGYVLRRIMRRAIRYGKSLGLNKPFLEGVTGAVLREMGEAYPHIKDAEALLVKVVNNEEMRFLETLEHGLQLLDEEIQRVAAGDKIVSGGFIFKLYDTFGFPFDIVRDVALEKGLGIDEQGFAAEMEKQREKSRQSRKAEGVRLLEEGVKSISAEGLSTTFIGYNSLETTTEAKVLLSDAGQRVSTLGTGQTGKLFVVETPFYAESGGQMGDIGTVSWDGGYAEVLNTVVEGEKIYLHEVKVIQGELAPGTEIRLEVDSSVRAGAAANHSATHLLQAALRVVLGDHIKQSGSLVGPKRLRFDFTHFSPLTDEEMRKIETLVNQEIRANNPVETRILQKEAAVAEGATALFGERYDDEVRVVSMADFSKELCGGTHVGATGEIGIFKILSETGIAAGVRRIEAIAGGGAFEKFQEVWHREKSLMELCNATDGDDVYSRMTSMMKEVKDLEKQIADLSRQLASADLDAVLQGGVMVEGIKVIHAKIPLDSPKTLREVGDRVRDKLESGVAVLGGVIGGKVALLSLVSKDLTDRIKAGQIVNGVASIVGGKGGGRPDMAQAGGPMADKIDDAIKAVPAVVEKFLRKS